MISVEQRKKYYLKFKEVNKDKIKEKIICPKCNGTYDYFNKSKHEKTKKHILFDEIQLLKVKYNI
jgi:protein-arginine kinase activator protein McsA